jgi:hypothetical protein
MIWRRKTVRGKPVHNWTFWISGKCCSDYRSSSFHLEIPRICLNSTTFIKVCIKKLKWIITGSGRNPTGHLNFIVAPLDFKSEWIDSKPGNNSHADQNGVRKRKTYRQKLFYLIERWV